MQKIKRKQNLKKAMSFMLAMLMIMSCWVFAPPVKADAVSQGTYTLTIVFAKGANGFDTDDEKVYIKAYAANGAVLYDGSIGDDVVDDDDTPGGTESFSGLTAFPAKVEVKANKSRILSKGQIKYTCKVSGEEISSADSGAISTSGWISATATAGTDKYPKATTVISTGVPSDNNIYHTFTAGRTSSETIDLGGFKVLDQYDVTLPTTPTITVDADSSQGITVAKDSSSTTYYYYYDYTIPPTARTAGGTADREVDTTISFAYNGGTAKRVIKLNLTDESYTNSYIYNLPLGEITGYKPTSQPGNWDTPPLIPSPEHEHYYFNGMYSVEDNDFYDGQTPGGTKLVQSITMKYDSPKTWYASWEAKKYDVKFVTTDKDDNAIIETRTIPYNQNVAYGDYDVYADPQPYANNDGLTHSSVKSWTKYDVDGKELASGMTTAQVNADLISQDVTYKASYETSAHEWTPPVDPPTEGHNGCSFQTCEVCGAEQGNKVDPGWYNVDFIDADGSNIKTYQTPTLDNQTVPEDEIPTEVPTKDADKVYTYTFSHWADVKDTTDSAYDFDTVLTDSVTLKPIFTPTYIDYTLTLKNEDGTTFETIEKVHADKPLFAYVAEKVPESTKVSDTAGYEYDFSYWAKEDGTEVGYTDMVEGDMTLTPVFELKPIQLTVQINDYNNGYLTTYKVAYGGTLDEAGFQSPTVDRPCSNDTHYVFKSWQKQDGTEVDIDSTRFYGTSKDVITVKPVYDEIACNWVVTHTPAGVGQEGYHVETCSVVEGETHKRNEQTFPALYEFKFMNVDDTVFYTEVLGIDDTLNAPTNNPIKPADETYTYEFANWTDKSGKVYDLPQAVNTNLAEGEYTYTLYPDFNETEIDYTIKWLNEDGSLYETTYQNYGETVVKPAVDPTKTVPNQTWTFDKWVAVAKDGEIGGITVDGDMIFQATFTDETDIRTVTVVDKNGEEITKVIVKNGDTLEGKIEEITQGNYFDETFHYTFDKWVFDGNQNDVLSTEILKDETIKPKYTAVPHVFTETTVKEATCHSLKQVEKVCECGYKATVEVEGTLLDHNMKEVVVKPDGATPGYRQKVCTNDGCGYQEAKTILWEVTFVSESLVLDKIQKDENDTITEGELPVATKANSADGTVYTFSHWANAQGEKVDFTNGYAVTKGETLTAVFDGAQYYTVTYSVNGTVMETKFQAENSLIQNADKTPETYSDSYGTYTFSHWAFAENNDATAIGATITGDVTVYAVFDRDEKMVEVTYNGNGGIFTQNSEGAYKQAQKAGSKADTAIVPEKDSEDGYAFDFMHWALTPDGEEYTGEITENTTLYAVYNPVKVYKITLMSEGEVYKVVEIRADQKLTQAFLDSIERPIKPESNIEVYGFDFWSNVGEDEKIALPIDVTSDLTLEAHYKVIEEKTYTVTFIDNDGTIVQQYTSLRYDSIFDKAFIPTMENKTVNMVNYIFKGWYNKNYPDLTKPIVIRSDITFEATYDQQDVTYTVMFMQNERTILRELEYVIPNTDVHYTGSKPVKDADAANHFEFNGWVTNMEDAEKGVQGVTIIENVTKNLVFYASYTAEKHDMVTQWQDVDCIHDGGMKSECTICGYSHVEVEEARWGHEYHLTEKGEPDEVGMIIDRYDCKKCGEEEFDSYLVEEMMQIDFDVFNGSSNDEIELVTVELLNEEGMRISKTFNIDPRVDTIGVRNPGKYEIVISGRDIEKSAGAHGTAMKIYVEISDADEQNVEVRGYEKVSECSCTCHKTGVWANIFRFFHKLFKGFTGGKIKCCSCPDELYYQ